ncbi:MAG: RNA polymerase sigma factor, partial [Actinobacteria bacterium]|nr:RNA polymerase sigma factor [Actinomycetota bacterium]
MDSARKPRLTLPRRALRLVSDERLVEQLRAGSASAFEEIYDRHHRGILAFCRQMLGSQQEAEDAVQHTFIAAHKSLLADNRQMALKAWLYVVARNHCLSLLRVRREHADIDDIATVLPATAGLSAEVERREDLRALLSDLQRLPENQRAALVLAELEAHSHEEIGVILGVPTTKVKALVFQARTALMSRRQARDVACGPIREQLAVLRGSALRRGELRHHVEQCAGCRAFASEVRHQRTALGVLLPVVPSLALKHSTLTAATAAAGAGAGAGAATVAGGAAASGSAVASTAAGGTAAASTAAAAGGGTAALTSGGALLGAKVIAAKAVIAVALTSVVGGGYVAVQQLPNDRSPAAHTTSVPPQKPATEAPSSGGVASANKDTCTKGPAAVPGRCVPAPPAKGDRDGDRVRNRQDECASKPAGTPNGCPASASGGPVSPGQGAAKGDRDGDGV